MKHRRVRVLLVEDDEEGHVLVRALLREGGGSWFALERAATYEAGLEAIRAGCHDAYLLAGRLGSRSGLELLGEAVAGGCRAPLILLAGRADRELDLAALRSGAAACLPRDQVTAALLERTLRYAVQRHRTTQALQQAQYREAVGRLAGGVAHHLNNVLTTVTGFSDLLLNSLPEDDSAREPLEVVRKAADQGADLVRQLLAFSRQQVLRPQTLDLNALLGGLGPLFRSLLGPATELSLVTEPNLCPVRADPEQIRQVLLTLVRHVRDALPRGGKVVLSTAATGPECLVPPLLPWEVPIADAAATGTGMPHHALLMLEDSRPGLDEKARRELFEPFSTGKGWAEGTGLSLPAARGIIEQSGGRLEVDSEHGSGARFRIFLPCAPGEREAGAAAATAGKTILVMEPELSVRELMGRVLRQLGYTVLEVTHVAEALRAAEETRVDLLVVDVPLPGMACRELIQTELTRLLGLKVLYLSTSPAELFRECGVPVEETAFLAKPFAPQDLSRKVAELLAGD